MRTSRVSIFLTDPRQSYRDNELTTPERIRELAKDQGISRVEEVSLGDAQFRCGGSAEYVKWVENNEALHKQLMTEAGFLAK